MPTAFEQSNDRPAFEHHRFVTDSVKELVSNRCVCEVTEKPLICSPFSVVSNKEGKLKLVLNLRHLNQYLRKDHFKYEDLRTALLFPIKEDFLIKFDLKAGYHHVEIFEPHQSYLGFLWDQGGLPNRG